MHPNITIHLLHRGEIASVLPFSQPLIRIGRVRELKDGINDIVLNAPRVSHKHAHILVDDAGLTVVDHSTNGTFVNGEPITAPRLLAPGDQIEIDVYTLRCEAGGAAAPVDPPREPCATRFPSLVPGDDELPVFGSPPMATLDLPDLPPPPSSRPSPAPATTPFTPDTLRSKAALSESSIQLAALYRELAAQFGASAWGRPAPLDGDALARVTEAARHAARERSLPAGLWPEWLARELCGLGPLASLLDDPAVTRIIVRGAEGIDVLRGTQREAAATRFSCPEALVAVLERWTGASLESTLDRAPCPEFRVHAWGACLSPSGPLASISRTHARQSLRLEDLVGDRTLPRAAADLLLLALQGDLNILIHGGPPTDLSRLLIALAGELPLGRGLTILRRHATWPKSHAIMLDGHSPAAWSCARRLDSDWLVVEDLAPGDLPDLVALGRHPGGGTLASVHARSADAALHRLAAMLSATSGELTGSRQTVATTFDVVVGVRAGPGGRLQVDSVAEIRPRGELAEMFTWNAETSTLEPTAVKSQVIR